MGENLGEKILEQSKIIKGVIRFFLFTGHPVDLLYI